MSCRNMSRFVSGSLDNFIIVKRSVRVDIKQFLAFSIFKNCPAFVILQHWFHGYFFVKANQLISSIEA